MIHNTVCVILPFLSSRRPIIFGSKVGSSKEFLNLTAEEATYVELKVAFGKALQDLRKSKQLTQVDLARRIQSSQSRVAKMEAADASVSLDLMLRSMFALGATRKKIHDLLKAS